MGSVFYDVRMADGSERAKPGDYYLLNTDGAMFNSGKRKHDDPPGEASVAVVFRRIKNGKDRLVFGFSCGIGPASNDVAEYRAVIEGLRFALDLGVTHIRVYMDSEFIVEQINDQADINEDDLRVLHAEVSELTSRFSPSNGFRISWVPRERNDEADALATAALP